MLYPFAIEPAIGTSQQGWLWSIGFALFVFVAAVMAWRMRGLPDSPNSVAFASQNGLPDAASLAPVQLGTALGGSKIGWRDRAYWLALPALASMMLIAVTNHLCQDVAVVPFLWIAPLSLYLISLIICFDRDQWYRPMLFAILAIFVILFVCDMAFMVYVYQNEPKQPRWVVLMKYDIRLLVTVYLGMFFLGCMLCHGEVVKRRPPPERLTEFYLTISAGGALGGFIVAIVCPVIFTTFAELKIGIVLTFILAVGVLLRQLGVFRRPHNSAARQASKGTKKRRPEKAAVPSVANGGFRIPASLRYPVGFVGLALVGVVTASQSMIYDASQFAGPKTNLRNFYGSLTVRDWYAADHEWHGRALYHGTILHGYQFLKPEIQLTPTTYYTESSGAGLTLRAIRNEQPIKVGAVGLGIGTVAAYGARGDTYRFYEINPLIIGLAKSSFEFLNKSQAEIEVVAGDARLSLEREEPQGFDALILDAFSGDSIPVHLLTREALEDYWRHLKPSGVLVVHISNRYVDLLPIVNRLAIEFGLHVAHIRSDEAVGLHVSSSEWMVLAKDENVFNHPSLSKFKSDPTDGPRFSLWTDDSNNLFEILRKP